MCRLHWRGLDFFITQFYGQIDKEALIIDLRWSKWVDSTRSLYQDAGPSSLQLCGRTLQKDRPDHRAPIEGQRPVRKWHVCVSRRDLAYAFRKAGLGKIIGNRTWGGLVGLPVIRF